MTIFKMHLKFTQTKITSQMFLKMWDQKNVYCYAMTLFHMTNSN